MLGTGRYETMGRSTTMETGRAFEARDHQGAETPPPETAMELRRDEIAGKLKDLRGRMRDRRLELVVLRQAPNVAWLTAGASTSVVLTSDTSAVGIAVSQDRVTILADTIEAPRLEDEEYLAALGMQIDAPVWWDTGSSLASLLARSRATGSDDRWIGPDITDISSDLRELRTRLRPGEIQRLYQAAGIAGQALQKTILELEPGMTELAIAGEVGRHTISEGAQVVVNLIASDQRITRYRHPLPTAKPVERYVMLVLCASVGGLIAAITRLVHFGSLPAELEDKSHAVAEIDARLILTSRPGRTLGDQFSCAEEAYREAGYPDAIREHHQGGSIGYLGREVMAQPGDPTVIESSQAFAWNPSIPGVKSEDTILVTPDGPEVLTGRFEWPVIPCGFAGESLNRPAILVR
ncbi:MAG: peptidase M24 [Chloroflexi bacterium]|nr:MAG: peptidase M24 [Chloroflexota bacterium]